MKYPYHLETFKGKTVRLFMGNEQYVQGVLLGQSENCLLVLSASKTMGNMMTFVPLEKVSKIVPVNQLTQAYANTQHLYSSIN
jgi:uncharacterized membrane protein